jgi:hypothetical protein
MRALKRFNSALLSLNANNWRAALTPVLVELCFNLESFNPAFASVVLMVQKSIGHSDYLQRDEALKRLIVPLAGEYGMHNGELQSAFQLVVLRPAVFIRSKDASCCWMRCWMHLEHGPSQMGRCWACCMPLTSGSSGRCGGGLWTQLAVRWRMSCRCVWPHVSQVGSGLGSCLYILPSITRFSP